MKLNIRERFKGRLFAFGAVFLMSLAPIAVKFGLREAIDPIPLLTMRFWVGAAVLWVCLLVFDPTVLKIRPGQSSLFSWFQHSLR